MGQIVTLKQPKDRIYSLAVNLHQLRRVFNAAKEGQLTVDKEELDNMLDETAGKLAVLLAIMPDELELVVDDIRELDNVIVASSMEDAQERIDNMEHEMPPAGTKIH